MLQRYSKEFIDVQVQFAERLSEVSGVRLGEMLAEHTLLRQLLDVSISRDDHSDPRWQKFVNGFSQSPVAADWAYEYYLKYPAPVYIPEQPRFGCFTFSYPFRGTSAVRLHFKNQSNERLLNADSSDSRREELKNLFVYLQQHYPAVERVRGGSWLYNIEPYRRLFPPEYIATVEPVGYETGFFALWGQFLHADGTVRMPAVNRFLACLAQETTVDGCISSFPYEVLRPECPIDIFYEYYTI
ncbi:MAG: hypothetical protein AAF702_24125 [Chloroflexota bacterium]